MAGTDSGRRRRKKGKNNSKDKAKMTNPTRLILVASIIVIAAVGLFSALLVYHAGKGTTNGSSSSVSSSSTSAAALTATTGSTATSGSKYVILYINQGNGAVNESNFDQMLSFAASQGFNTIFFQVYREGVLLFDSGQLTYFVDQAHDQRMKIFFCLYFTNSTQQIPTSVYPLGEDGISLDMSTLPLSTQTTLLSTLQSGYSGKTAITTTDLTLPLTPDLLVLETYTSDIQQYSGYIHPGVVASVGVFATTSKTNYEQELQYALQNSDGVMVFDYAGLMKSGY